jgi:putative sigma-54 modulation protein
MNIDFVGRHQHVDERAKAHTEEKLTKLAKFLHEPIEIRVTFAHEKHRQQVEIHVSHKQGTLQTEENHDVLLEAVNLATETIERQARRAHEKSIDRRRRADRAHEEDLHWPVEVLEAASLGNGIPPRIVKSSRLLIKPMTVDEAALALHGSKNDFIVFFEATSSQVQVLYRRRDQNFGLIAPDWE